MLVKCPHHKAQPDELLASAKDGHYLHIFKGKVPNEPSGNGRSLNSHFPGSHEVPQPKHYCLWMNIRESMPVRIPLLLVVPEAPAGSCSNRRSRPCENTPLR